MRQHEETLIRRDSTTKGSNYTKSEPDRFYRSSQRKQRMEMRRPRRARRPSYVNPRSVAEASHRGHGATEGEHGTTVGNARAFPSCLTQRVKTRGSVWLSPGCPAFHLSAGIQFPNLRAPAKSPNLPLPVVRRGSQVVRPRSAKPLCVGSIPTRASTFRGAKGALRSPKGEGGRFP
jgi:hypothetical protein